MFQNVAFCCGKSKIKKFVKQKNHCNCSGFGVIAPGFEPGTYSLEDIFQKTTLQVMFIDVVIFIKNSKLQKNRIISRLYGFRFSPF